MRYGKITSLSDDYSSGTILEDYSNSKILINNSSISKSERPHLKVGVRVSFDMQIRFEGYTAQKVEAA